MVALIIVCIVGRCAVVVHAAGILRVGVLVACSATVFLGQKLFNLPGIRLDADRKLEIFFRNVIPELESTLAQDWEECRSKPTL